MKKLIEYSITNIIDSCSPNDTIKKKVPLNDTPCTSPKTILLAAVPSRKPRPSKRWQVTQLHNSYTNIFLYYNNHTVLHTHQTKNKNIDDITVLAFTNKMGKFLP